ncbi:two-component response regulator, putative [Heliomicrobium modesticaldum Ice1]|uniref:Stage 0 sporulation protein A homolog n=1 Tax=Heliobacterium modesticaldum (strain ATCC 51547 / Ice1) TaxID=498761 RepID=B0TG81_HELMI|nr:response regulator [Heliomicrobium modesticaldum]ABZ84577.1 two-component response regulator, putative [Heliomicrobium modesticaldum Ice1]
MKILVVDDSIVYRTQIVKLLRDNLPEADFVTAGDGVAGLTKFIEEKPDVTLLDLLMPGMNGQEVLKKIKEISPEARVIVLTADIQKFIEAEVRELGAWTFVHKPITREKAKQVAQLIKGA